MSDKLKEILASEGLGGKTAGYNTRALGRSVKDVLGKAFDEADDKILLEMNKLLEQGDSPAFDRAELKSRWDRLQAMRKQLEALRIQMHRSIAS